MKFEGCYHGHVDALLVKAGSGVATLGIPGTPSAISLAVVGSVCRMAASVATFVAPWNDRIILVDWIAPNPTFPLAYLP